MIGKQLDLFGGPPKPPKQITVDDDPVPVEDVSLNSENESSFESSKTILEPNTNTSEIELPVLDDVSVFVHVQMPEMEDAGEGEAKEVVNVEEKVQDVVDDEVVKYEEDEVEEAILDETVVEVEADVKVNEGLTVEEQAEVDLKQETKVEVKEAIEVEEGGEVEQEGEEGKEGVIEEGNVDEVMDLKDEKGSAGAFLEDTNQQNEPDKPNIESENEKIAESEVEVVTIGTVPVVPANLKTQTEDNTLEANADEPKVSNLEHSGEQPTENENNGEGALNIPPDPALYSRQYYTMRETAGMFNVNQSLLRFWENEFDILKPKKNRKGDRYFRPDDIKNLELIYHLLKVRKFTIGGAKDYLKTKAKSLDTFEMVQRLENLKQFLLELKTHL